MNSHSKGKTHNSNLVKKTFNIQAEAITTKKTAMRYNDQTSLLINRLCMASKKETNNPVNWNSCRKKGMEKEKKFKTSKPSPEKSIANVNVNENESNITDNPKNFDVKNIISGQTEGTLALMKKKLWKKSECRHTSKSNFLNFTNPVSTHYQIQKRKASTEQKKCTPQVNASPCIVSVNTSSVKQNITKNSCQITEEKEKNEISQHLNIELQHSEKKNSFISPLLMNNYVNNIMSKINKSTESKIVFNKFRSTTSTPKMVNTSHKAKMTSSTTPVTSKHSRTNSKEKKIENKKKNINNKTDLIQDISEKSQIKLHNTFNIKAILSKQSRFGSVINSNYVSHQSNASNVNNSTTITENKFLRMNMKPKVDQPATPMSKFTMSECHTIINRKADSGIFKANIHHLKISNVQKNQTEKNSPTKRINPIYITQPYGPSQQMEAVSVSSSRPTMREMNYFQKEADTLSNSIKKFFAQYSDYPPTSLNFYKIGRIIGHGAFGKVNIGLHILSGRLVAIKSFNISNPKFSKNKIIHEVALMKNLRHHSVVQIYETLETERYVLVIIEYVGGGDLLTFIKKRIKLNEVTAKFIFRQIIEALQYIHSQNIVHRDIKLDNILIDLTGNIKICDFGVARHVKKGVIMNDLCGTPAYIAPEILKNEGYQGFSVDVWSAGVVLYAMISGTVPFKAMNEHELHKLILEGKYSAIPDISSEAADLLCQLLETDPKKRIRIEDILHHPWICNVEDSHTGKAKSKITLFTNAEKILLSKSNIDYRTAKQEDIIEMFTMKNLDTLQESENQNIGTQSRILAPFNSSILLEGSNLSFVHMKIDHNNNLLKFCGQVKELNRNYELNYNGEIDHGKLIQNQNSIQINHNSQAKGNNICDDGDNGDSRSNVASRKISQPTSPPELANSGKLGISDQKEECHRNARKKMREMLSTDANTLVFEEKVIKVLEGIGYKREYVMKCLSNNELNHATATYYLFLSATSE